MAIVKGDYYQLIGTKLDRYLIQSVAGIGGMGTVYRAQHEIHKGYVAIKVLRPENLPDDQNSIPMFFEEAVKTVSLSHPLIVKVIGADYTDRGLAYMVMEWLDGHTLAEEMTKQETLPCERVAELLDQICDAVAYAHDNNVIHRDLKPGNIMLVPDRRGNETIRVLDFGIAKALTSTVGTNTRIAGSSYYISPEQTIARGRIDHCTDIYSLGVMLYQMLTGKVPFDADTAGQIIDMHRTLDPVRLCQVNSEIPVGVEEVVMKALAKRPGDRYQNATDLARAFRQAAQMASGVIVLECTDEDDDSPVATATIYLNSRHAGQTDETGCWQLGGLTPRKYLIEVEAPNYERWHASESLGGREEVTVPVALKRKPKGELVIYCGVAGAEVELDGAKIGKTDQTGRLYLDSVDAGSHAIKLTHPKYLPAESNVEIAIWQQALCELTMTERPRFQFKQLWQKATGASGKLRTTSDTTPAVVKLGLEETPLPGVADPFKTFVPDETLPEPGPATTLQTCEKCGARVPIGLKFCIECGEPFARKGETTGGEKSAEASAYTTNLLPEPLTEAAPTEVPSKPTPDTPPIMPLSPESLPYATLPSRREPQPKKNSLLIGVAVIAAALLALLIWGFYPGKQEVPTPETFDLTIKVSPPESEVTIGDRVLGKDAEGNFKAKGIKAGETIKASSPCYEAQTRSITSPTTTPVEISLKKIEEVGMVCIPARVFTMGVEDAKCSNPQVTPTPITLDPFLMDKTEITREEYKRFIEKEGYTAKPSWVNFPEGTGQFPVTDIKWPDAMAYAKSVGKRLPTEAEWEFVARGGGQDRRYPWGDFFEPGKANVENKRGGLVRVDQFPPSEPFGIYGLSGNVSEWTDNIFPGNPYADEKICAECKVLRGGSYFFSSDFATTTCRILLAKDSSKEDYSSVGFRCVKNIR